MNNILDLYPFLKDKEFTAMVQQLWHAQEAGQIQDLILLATRIGELLERNYKGTVEVVVDGGKIRGIHKREYEDFSRLCGRS